MPTFIPKNPCFNGNVSEEKIFNLLKSLPDDCIVCHELEIQERRPDFIVFSPRLGILIIEVKAWHISTILSGDQNTINLKNKYEHLGESKPTTHPIKQVNGYLYRLRDDIFKNPLYKEIVNSDNTPHKGKLVFPIAIAIAFTNITKSQWDNHGIQNSNAKIPSVRLLLKDELDLLSHVDDSMELEKNLKRFFTPSWSFTLSEKQKSVVRSMLSHEPITAIESVVVVESATAIEPEIVIESVTVTEPKIKNVVDSILQHYFSLETEKYKKSKDMESVKTEINLLSTGTSPDIDNNDFIHQHSESINRLVSKISQGINENAAHDADELYSHSKAIKLKTEETTIKNTICHIEKQQQALKLKLSRLASILEVEIA